MFHGLRQNGLVTNLIVRGGQSHTIATTRGYWRRYIHQISQLDFWAHKNWILQINLPLSCGDPISKYISCAQINSETRSRFEFLNHRGPYQLKLQQLELSWEYSSWDGTDPIEAERDCFISFLGADAPVRPDIASLDGLRI